MKIEFLKPS